MNIHIGIARAVVLDRGQSPELFFDGGLSKDRYVGSDNRSCRRAGGIPDTEPPADGSDFVPQLNDPFAVLCRFSDPLNIN